MIINDTFEESQKTIVFVIVNLWYNWWLQLLVINLLPVERLEPPVDGKYHYIILDEY